jgi:hypothetical protein
MRARRMPRHEQRLRAPVIVLIKRPRWRDRLRFHQQGIDRYACSNQALMSPMPPGR